MPKIKRKAIYDPVAERKKWTEHFRDRYLSIFLAKWGIEGATEEEDRFIKRTLYLDGKISAWRASDDLVVFSPFAPQGFNIYGSPLSGLPIRLQGADFFPDKALNTYALRNNEARGVDEPEIVLGYALPNKKSVFSQIEALVQERVEIAMAKATNRIGCKIPMLLLTTPENRKALEQFASDVLNDEAIVSIGVTEVDGISCVNTGIPYLLDKFEAYDQNLDGKILSMLGVDNSGARKMEREVVDEVNSNNALINLASEAFKNEVSGFLDRVNGAFGTGYRLVDKMPKVDSFHDGPMENGEEENKEDEKMRFVEISEYTLKEAIGNDVFADAQLEFGFSGLIASDLFTPQIGENLKNVLLARFGEETAVWAEVGKEEEEIENFRYRFYGYLFSTAIRWIDRLSLYDESKSKGLLSGVKSTSTNRDYANDSPSIKDPAVEDLSHVSYFTKATNESETDMGTPASRYEEAIKVDGSVYAQWADDIGTHFSLGV